MEWIKNPDHIIFFFSLFICIIIGQGIIIYNLLRNKPEYEYGSSNIAKKIEKFREFWGLFVVYVMATSIIALFIASFTAKQNIELNDMNTWVSLILGMIALTIGIISLFLSFYNVEQSVQAQKDSLNIMNAVKEDIKDKLTEIDKRVESGFKGLHDDIYKYRDEMKADTKNSEKNSIWGKF